MSIPSRFPWTCRNCLTRSPSRATQSSPISRFPRQIQSRLYSSNVPKIPKPSRRYRVLLGGATGALVLGTAVTFTEDGRHYIGAAQRTIRVVKTLGICINEYVTNSLSASLRLLVNNSIVIVEPSTKRTIRRNMSLCSRLVINGVHSVL